MSEAAVQLDDLGQADLRSLADRMLETTRVEYVDEGVLLVMNPPGFEHRRTVRSIVDGIKKAFYTSVTPVKLADLLRGLPMGSGRRDEPLLRS